jgi:acetyl-CoA carboxylase biotin carboxyl carrier protein
MEIDMRQLRELMRALRQFDLSEIDIQQGEHRIKVRRQPTRLAAEPAGLPRASVPHVEPIAGASGRHTPLPAEEAGIVYVTSPFVGTFYRSPSPEAPPFAEVGQNVVAGQVICIIEAMKLMNEIESEVTGKVLEVLAENGKPVEYGQRLFRVQKA